MVFSSLVFVCIFLPLVVTAYYLLPARFHNLVLLVASVLFYAWSGFSGTLLVLSLVGANFLFGWLIGRCSGHARLVALVRALIVNIAVFGVLKYAGFLIANVNTVLALLTHHRLPVWSYPLPLGISFFTFHIISYLVDVYRGSVKAQPSPVAFALYILNFPQLIAGPIIRYRQIADQLPFRAARFEDVDAGMGRFTVGLVKKLMIADPIGSVVDQIFRVSPDQLTTSSAWLGALCYGLQIYFDFSGYTDMAIGLARVFGFRFPENFNYPYRATSMQDFWRRWHITLSAWFRDYVYIPLGGNRRGPWITARNLWLVFLLAGAWHGASWSFIVWGLWQGLFLWVERLEPVKAAFEKVPMVLRHCYLLLAVLFGWVFFRAPDLRFALSYLERMLGIGTPANGLPLIVDLSPQTVILIGRLVACRCRFGRGSAVPSGYSPRTRLLAKGVLLSRAVLITAVMVLSLSIMAGQQYIPFIYFRF